MERLLTFVGIDVSKDRLDVHIRPSGRTVAVQRKDTCLARRIHDVSVDGLT